MTDNQMASDIKWHRLDDMDDSTYPKKIGELYLVRIYHREKGHHYAIARLWDAIEYKKRHPDKMISSKEKYIFASDGTDLPIKKKSEGHSYIDGWNDLMFAAETTRVSRSESSGSSKVWLDLRNKKSTNKEDKK